MKTAVGLLILLTLFSLFSLNAFAQDYIRWELPDGAQMRLGKGTINEMRYSPDGTRFAVVSSIGIWLYDTTTYRAVSLLPHESEVNSVAFSPDGRTIASGGGEIFGFGTVQLWDAASGQHKSTLTGHTDLVHSVAFSPDGKTVASGSWDATVRLWDVESDAIIHTLTGHTDPYGVVSVVFSPDGKRLASVGHWQDGTVRLWDAESGAAIHNHRV